MPSMDTHDTPCTAADRQRIIDAAVERRDELLRLARLLDQQDGWAPMTVRRRAAQAIRQLIGETQ